jgi:phosphatidylglycerol:prolipoprotein diacylglycerol transferase
MQYYHPVFLYELLWILPAFFLLHALAPKKRFEGQTFLAYLAWYGLGMAFIEPLREESLTLGVFRTAQVAGFFCFAIGTLLLVLHLYRARRERLAGEEYRPAYEKFARPVPKKEEDSQHTPETSALSGEELTKQYENLFGEHPTDDKK